MSTPVIHADPFRLRVQKAIVASLEQIAISDGYGFDMAGKVFRGRDTFGDGDPIPMISILEPPLPIDQIISPTTATGSIGQWDLMIQGFVEDDRDNPTDPAHRLMADVKRRLALEKKRTAPGTAGTADPFGMGIAQVVNGKAVGNIITEVLIGPGVVRPPETAVSNKAYFWQTLTLKISEDMAQPFL